MEQRRIETEQTSKTWKKLKIVSVLLIIAGLISLLAESLPGFIICFLGASATGIIARVGAWWTNG